MDFNDIADTVVSFAPATLTTAAVFGYTFLALV